MKKENISTLKRLINKKATEMMKTPKDSPALFHQNKKDLEKLIARFQKAGGDIHKPLNQ